MQNIEHNVQVQARDIFVPTEEVREEWDYRNLVAEILARMERLENEKQPEPEKSELR